MLDAYNYDDVTFYLGENGNICMHAPGSIWSNPDIMQLINSNKIAIQNQLEQGFDCVRDRITYHEFKLLTAIAEQDEVGSMERVTE